MTAITNSTKAVRRAERKAVKLKRLSEKSRKPLVAKTEAQQFYMSLLSTSDQIFAVGGAGTGKTYIAARHAVAEVLAEKREKIMIARPTVAKDKHKLGFLPGSLEEKIGPWFVPILEAMRDEASATTVEGLLKAGQIEFLSFEHLRGRSLRESVVILDEAQNCDFSDLRLFLTRIGEDSQIIVCGDMDQTDVPDSGLHKVIDMIEKHDISASIVEFTDEDVIRSKIAKEWVEAFSLA